MNKIFSLALLCSAALSFTACVNEEDDLFSKTAAERLNEASSLYSKRLTASPNGWAVQLYPTKQDEAPYGNGYLLMFRFHENKTVDASMLNSLSNDLYQTDTSTWNVITDNGPVLSFDTYNTVIHTFSDPEDVPSTGTQDNKVDETGTGIGGDYEFVIVDAPEDASYMMLKGKKRGTYNLMTPVEDGVDYESYLYGVREFQKELFSSTLASDTLHVGGVKLKFEDAAQGMPAIYAWDGDKVVNGEFNPFLITKRGDDFYLRFRDAKKYGDLSVQELKWNQEKDVFEDVTNPEIYLEGANPATVFDSLLVKDSRKWILDNSCEMTGQFKTLYDKVAEAMSAKGGNLLSLSINRSANDNQITLTYRAPKAKQNSTVDYVFSITKGDNTETFAYVSTKTGQGVLNSLPELKELFDFMGQTFSVSAARTRFDLSWMKFTSASNSNDSFQVRL